MKTKLSLIICSKNRASQLKRCLASINAKEILEVSGELILVNNASTDDTEKVMGSFKENSCFPVKIVHEPEPGLGRARNAGILKAKGDILIFTDDDCYLTPGYLTEAKKIFKSGDFHYCGGRILLYDKTDAMYTVRYLKKQIVIPPYTIVYPGQISGCNMVIHRKVVDKIGLFDPMFGVGTLFPCEDVDYVTRASLAGFKGALIPELVIYHHHGRKLGADIENLVKYYAYARGAYFMKLILMGKITALKPWVRSFTSLKKYLIENLFIKNSFFLFIREIRGGMHYLFVRIEKS